ncbi:MAG: hypothetical protein LUF90_01635 [Rikenellaceae bacterium]|nr:hypothetical protein [Rikenellaceae bacterium]
MDKNEFYEIISQRFYGNCNDEWANLILKNDLVTDAMDIALNGKGVQSFRSAYGLETAFFRDIVFFRPYYKRIVEDYNKISNESVMRHYGKIVYHIINRKLFVPDENLLNELAETVCTRAIDPRYKIAVKVWAMYIITIIYDKVPWTTEYLPDILDTLSHDPTPEMASCLKKVKQKIIY